MIPRLLDRERRGALAALVALALAEAACLAGAALAVGAGIEAGSALGLATAIGFCVVAAGASWLRQTMAEDFGARYSGALRHYLAEAAVTAAGAGKPGRLGLLAVRMTGDLNALREWASVGVGEAASSAALFIAAVTILAVTAGPMPTAAIALSALAPLCLATALLTAPLLSAHGWLRQERGRVASLSGDIVQATRTLWALNGLPREARRLARRNESLRAASVLRRRLAAGIQVQALLTVGAGGACAVVLIGAGALVPLAAGAWAQVLLALGLLSTSAAGCGRALDAACAYWVGFDRLDQLDDHGEPARQPASAPAEGWVQDHVADIRWLAMNDVRDAQFHLEALWAGEVAKSSKRARRPLAAPAMPLIRASVQRNLTLGRRAASREALLDALDAVGLDPGGWPLDAILDPIDPALDGWTQARLRLARGLVMQPEVLYVAEPLLAAEATYASLIRHISLTYALPVVAVRPLDMSSVEQGYGLQPVVDRGQGASPP